MRLPTDSRWTQTNSGELLGFLNKTRNVHFDIGGTVSLSKRPVIFFSSADDADVGYILGILYFNNTYNLLTSDELFIGDIDGTSMTQLGASSFDLGSDMAVVFGRLYASYAAAIFHTDGASWTDSTINVTSGNHHPIAVFENQADDKLAIGDGNTVKLYDSSHSIGNTLTLDANYEIICMRYRNGYLWIGTKNTDGGEASVFIWDGSGSRAQFSVPAGASWIFSMTEYGSSVAIVTNAGQIRQVSGNSMQTLANFPIYHAQGKTWQGSNGLSVGGKVFNRGMITDGDRIHICISGVNEGDQVDGMYSGLWTYDPDIGLFHRSGIPREKVETQTNQSISNDTITCDAFDAETGDPIFVLNAGSITGITTGETYFVIKVSSTSYKFASTRADAHNGEPRQLGGSIGALSTRTVQLVSLNEIYGAEQGAVALVNSAEHPKEMWNGGILFGGRTENNRNVFCALTPAQNKGSFTTQKLYSSNIKETWQRIYNHLKGIYLANEQLIVKVRTKDKLGMPILPQAITWDDTTAFQTADLTVWGAVAVGDEITIVHGVGAGLTAHITVISKGATTYTITVDEAIGTAATSTNVIAENFQKVDPAVTNALSDQHLGQVDLQSLKSNWIQVRVELRGYETEISLIDLLNASDKVG